MFLNLSLLWFLLTVASLISRSLFSPSKGIHYGAMHGDFLSVSEYLRQGINPNLVGEGGSTPLHLACRQGHSEIVKLLVEHGAQVNDIEDDDRMTPLYIAAMNKHQDIVDFLIARGATVETHLLAFWGDFNAVRDYLSKGGDPNVKRPISKSKFYLDRSRGETLLYLASEGGHEEVVNLLITNGADINAQDVLGYTPLHRATLRHHVNVVEILLANSANVNVVSSSGYGTPLHIASYIGNRKLVELLLLNGADVNQKARLGGTSLHEATRNGNRDIVTVLVDNGADVNARSTSDGSTALHEAARKGSKEIAQLLLAHGAHVNARTALGFTPLSLVSYRYPDLNLLLVSYGAVK
jgi:ankyrin repeat protein